MSGPADPPDQYSSDFLPDSQPAHISLRLASPALLPFVQLARLDRPIGWWLLLLPCWWADALAGIAAKNGPDLWHDLLFLIGAVAMRGAGSTWNDLVDREMDAKVERTRGRPLPSGRVSPRAAKLFLVAQSLIGAAVLFSLNWFAVATGFASLLIVAIYPFMKRISSWPQAVLGLAFAYGGLMGWAAAFGRLDAPAWLIYLAAIFWTMGYDTIYALQDSRDDAIAGIRSTARLFGSRVRDGVGILYLGAILSGMAAILLARGGLAAMAGLFGFALHLGWQLRRIGPDITPALALRLFRANRDAGFILFVGLAIDGWLRMLLT